MNNRNRRIVIVLLVLTIVFTLAGSTFAYWSWTSSNNTLVTFTVNSNFSCAVDGGGSISGQKLVPADVTKTSSQYVIKRAVKVMPTISGSDSILMGLWLNVNTLGTGLSNSNNFKYVFNTSSTDSTTGVVASGNFKNKTAGGKVNLFTSKSYSATAEETYYLWIWLDKEETSTSTMNQAFSFSLGGKCTNGPAPSFANDSWATIASYVASATDDDPAPYSVGDTKEVTLTGFTNTASGSNGKYTLRIANNSNYSCKDSSGSSLASETACGFVVEFVDIITNYNMNPSGTHSNGTTYSNGWNVGGWPASTMRTYVKNTIYNALPSDLKSVIQTTTTVSSHGATSEESNFTVLKTSTDPDKLYLLSPEEVWGDWGTSVDGPYDTAKGTSVQLDYYREQGVTTSSSSEAIKHLNGTASYWWLRGARSNRTFNFFLVKDDGAINTNAAKDEYGVAPAFRL